MPKNPLAEVFGYPVESMSSDAARHRQGKLCPFHNSSGLNCTKNSATDPLGVCSIVHGSNLTITCPVRFRQNHLIISDAANFFFPNHDRYVALTEVRLDDRHGKSAGNIDIALVALNDEGEIVDFGALEIQAVYISGNIGKIFKEYMKNPAENYTMDWPSKNYPKPDYLSSSRKRLAPQLIYKGGILNGWGKKMAVAVQRPFFEQLPALPTVPPHQADIAWMIYDLNRGTRDEQHRLEQVDVRYTQFQASLDAITSPEPGEVDVFVASLAARLKTRRMMGLPPQSGLSPNVEPPFLSADDQGET